MLTEVGLFSVRSDSAEQHHHRVEETLQPQQIWNRKKNGKPSELGLTAELYRLPESLPLLEWRTPCRWVVVQGLRHFDLSPHLAAAAIGVNDQHAAVSRGN